MRLLYRYITLWVAATVLLMTSCEINVGIMDEPTLPPDDAQDVDPGFGVKPTVPLKRRPIVPTNKLPRPRIVEHIGWTAAGTLSVALTDDSPMVVTLIESDGTMRGYVADGRGVEISNVPADIFELQIDIDGESYSVVVE